MIAQFRAGERHFVDPAFDRYRRLVVDGKRVMSPDQIPYERFCSVTCLRPEAAVIDFRASEVHFLDHLAPIWHALDPNERGGFSVDPTLKTVARRHGIEPTTDANLHGKATVVASWGDLKRARQRGPVIYAEHGAGQTYQGNPSGSYIGAADRAGVVGVLVPGPYALDAQRAAHPNLPAYAIGCPKLDLHHANPAPPRLPGLVVMTHHWDCPINPETGSAWKHYHSRPVCSRCRRLITHHGVTLAGHAHPRDTRRMARHCDALAIPYYDRFDQVLTDASVLIADNTSVLYEFASLDRPVVVLNAPAYRTHVHHGLRFWSHIPGEQVDHPDRLHRAIRRALDADPFATQRRKVVADVYAVTDGTAAARAADAIRDLTQ